MKTLFAATAVAITLAGNLSAQVADIRDTDAAGYVVRAEAMLQSGNAAGAIDQLNSLERLQMKFPANTDLREKALLLKAFAQLQCNDAACLETAGTYIKLYGGSIEAQQMRVLRGDYYFFHADFEHALPLYDEVQFAALTPLEAETVKYRKAYSTLRLAQYADATYLFEELVGSREYGDAARFYLAYIDYVNGKYVSARRGFEQYVRAVPDDIANAKKYRIPQAPDASCYIAQIDFAEGRYGNVVSVAPELLRRCTDAEMEKELNRIIGESLFNLKRETKAESYLQKYLKEVGTDALPTSQYMMGVIRYNQKDYAEAVEFFEPVAAGNDALGQSASLYLGQCEMKLDEPGAATVAFERAYRMNYNSAVSETALYNYAAMLTSGSGVPFGRSSVELLEQFVKKYPNSEFADRADEYLATAYFNEKNYRQALQSINRIVKPSDTVLKAKQKILYELGVECLSNNMAAEAVCYMQDASKMHSIDNVVATRSLLWLADAYYNIGDYAKAEANYKYFLQTAPIADSNLSLAEYDLGYALYQQNKFVEARGHFEKVLKVPGKLDRNLVSDARTRVADCLYYTGNHSLALDTYKQSMQENANNADYAALQHANMLGSLGRNTEKITALDEMIANYPESSLLPSAMLEKAQTYIDLGNDAKAIDTYTSLVRKYPQAPESRQGLLQMAIAYSNSGKRDKAEECYKQVISTWPTSEQAKAANEDLRVMYAASGKLEEYAKFLHRIPGAPSMDDNEIEKLSFEAAENAMLLNANDTDLMFKYVNQYPNGRYLDRALYSTAAAKYAAGKYSEALQLLETLNSKRPDSASAPEATLMRARIYEDTDMGSSRDAVAAWRDLLGNGGATYYNEACAGIMRNTDNPSEQLEYANRLIKASGLSTEQMDEAVFYRAMAELKRQQYKAAVEDLERLTDNPKSLYGARATVELADYYMGKKQYSKAQELLEQFTDSGTPHQYWLARAYISLADAYYAQGKQTLARQYVNSLKENYPGSEADIRQMIKDRTNKWK